MSALPEVVTHRYDPAYGVCLNLCSLSDGEARQVLERLRQGGRPNLKPDYLARRRTTERWLALAARQALGRSLERWPVYFFLGDFSHRGDPSRPAALVIPLASLPKDAITFTLGDSMTVAEQAARRVYTFDEMLAFFANGEAVTGFGLSNASGVQPSFVEMQLWDKGALRFNRKEWAAPDCAQIGTWWPVEIR